VGDASHGMRSFGLGGGGSVVSHGLITRASGVGGSVEAAGIHRWAHASGESRLQRSWVPSVASKTGMIWWVSLGSRAVMRAPLVCITGSNAEGGELCTRDRGACAREKVVGAVSAGSRVSKWRSGVGWSCGCWNSDAVWEEAPESGVAIGPAKQMNGSDGELELGDPIMRITRRWQPVSRRWGRANRSAVDQRRWAGENRMAELLRWTRCCSRTVGLVRAKCVLLGTAGGEWKLSRTRRACAVLVSNGNWFQVPALGKVSVGRLRAVRRPSPTEEDSNSSREAWESGMVVGLWCVCGVRVVMERKTGRGWRPLYVVRKQGGRRLDCVSARIDRVSRKVWDQHAVGDWGS